MPLYRGKYVPLLTKDSMYKKVNSVPQGVYEIYMKCKAMVLNFWCCQKISGIIFKNISTWTPVPKIDTVKNGMRPRDASIYLSLYLSIYLPTYLGSTGNSDALKVDIKY